MAKRARDQLTYANVIATLALFVALGGTGYAALNIGSEDIRNNSIRGKDIRRGAIGGREVNERKLGAVRRARNASRLGGQPATAFKVRCPAGTLATAGACIETTARAALPYFQAAGTCAQAGRRLPTHAELALYLGGGPGRGPAGGRELTSDLTERSTTPEEDVWVVAVTSGAGGFVFVPNGVAGTSSYRCVAYPSN